VPSCPGSAKDRARSETLISLENSLSNIVSSLGRAGADDDGLGSFAPCGDVPLEEARST
jgi:hypothetical protein